MLPLGNTDVRVERFGGLGVSLPILCVSDCLLNALDAVLRITGGLNHASDATRASGRALAVRSTLKPVGVEFLIQRRGLQSGSHSCGGAPVNAWR